MTLADVQLFPDGRLHSAKKQTLAASPDQEFFKAEAMARFRCVLHANVGYVERLVHFWSNHFCVSVAKSGLVRATAGAFEREAIRPHVLGRFSDMLLAVTKHPAMLHYLDNVQSIGPNSKAGQKGKRGLNENLARELLELHTLGVDGGYSQADVTSLAGILTGWSVVGAKGARGSPARMCFLKTDTSPAIRCSSASFTRLREKPRGGSPARFRETSINGKASRTEARRHHFARSARRTIRCCTGR